MDVIAAFIRGCCVVEPQRQVSTGELYAEYVGWCTQMGETPVSQKGLAAALKERGCTPRRGGEGRLWCGIALREDEADPQG
jgi:hypothetical protein